MSGRSITFGSVAAALFTVLVLAGEMYVSEVSARLNAAEANAYNRFSDLRSDLSEIRQHIEEVEHSVHLTRSELQERIHENKVECSVVVHQLKRLDIIE